MQFLQLELLKAQERRRSAAAPPPDLNGSTAGRGQAADRTLLNTTKGGRSQVSVQTRAGGRAVEAARPDLNTSTLGLTRQKAEAVAQVSSEVRPNAAPQETEKEEVKTGKYRYRTFLL